MSGLELAIIRHAPALTGGRLTGRRDVAATLDDTAALAWVAEAVGDVDTVVSSPARRCCQTPEAVFPGRAFTTDPRLWEQDFGAHEGLKPSEIPDVGVLDRATLAALRAPEGESFADVVARVTPALEALSGKVAVVAHAGTVRAALALALGDVPVALAFEVAPLSVTRVRRFTGGYAVTSVNEFWRPAYRG